MTLRDFSLSKKQASLTKGIALRSVPRLFAAGEQFDTRYVRRIFSDVHAAGENDQNYFLPAGKKLCEAFFDSIRSRKAGVTLRDLFGIFDGEFA